LPQEPEVPKQITKSYATDPGLESLPSVDASMALSFRGRRGLTDSALSSMLRVGLLGGIRSLDLGGCNQITDSGLGVTQNLTSLVRLCLEGCKSISRVGIAALRFPSQLVELDVSECDVDDHCVARLLEIPSLKVLHLRGTAVTTGGLLEVIPAARLTSLDVSRCPGVAPESLGMIARNLGMPPGAVIRRD